MADARNLTTEERIKLITNTVTGINAQLLALRSIIAVREDMFKRDVTVTGIATTMTTMLDGIEAVLDYLASHITAVRYTYAPQVRTNSEQGYPFFAVDGPAGTVTSAAAVFLTAGFAADDKIMITHAEDSGNNGIHTLGADGDAPSETVLTFTEPLTTTNATDKTMRLLQVYDAVVV